MLHRLFATALFSLGTAPLLLAQYPMVQGRQTGLTPSAVAGAPQAAGSLSCPIVSSCAHPLNEWGGVAFAADGTLWVTQSYGSSGTEILGLDTANCSVLQSFVFANAIGGATHDGTHLWLVEEQLGTAFRVDPATGAVVHSIPLPGIVNSDPNSSGIAWDGSSLWHADYTFDSIYQLDPANGNVLSSFALDPALQLAGGLVYNAGILYLSEAATDAIYQIDSVTGAILDSCTAPAFHGWGLGLSPAGDLWVSDIDLQLYHLGTGLGSGLGTPYCTPGQLNSTGVEGVMVAFGTDSVVHNNFHLRATQLPANQFGFFLGSKTQGLFPFPGGSQGILCLGLPIARFLGSMGSSGSGGALSYAVDLTNIPMSPPVAVNAGETWYFQCWYRDLNPNQTSNFTAGVEVLFQ